MQDLRYLSLSHIEMVLDTWDQTLCLPELLLQLNYYVGSIEASENI